MPDRVNWLNASTGIDQYWEKKHRNYPNYCGWFQNPAPLQNLIDGLTSPHSGWWRLEHNCYFSILIGNVIIPIDELIFFRGVDLSTNQSWSFMIIHVLWGVTIPVLTMLIWGMTKRRGVASRSFAAETVWNALEVSWALVLRAVKVRCDACGMQWK